VYPTSGHNSSNRYTSSKTPHIQVVQWTKAAGETTAVAEKTLEIIEQDTVRTRIKLWRSHLTHNSQIVNALALHHPVTAAMTDAEIALLPEGQDEDHLHVLIEIETTTAAAIAQHQALHLHRANPATELRRGSL
jgi:hypothetical protein